MEASKRIEATIMRVASIRIEATMTVVITKEEMTIVKEDMVGVLVTKESQENSEEISMAITRAITKTETWVINSVPTTTVSMMRSLKPSQALLLTSPKKRRARSFSSAI